jgi:hypothetical protein
MRLAGPSSSGMPNALYSPPPAVNAGPLSRLRRLRVLGKALPLGCRQGYASPIPDHTASLDPATGAMQAAFKLSLRRDALAFGFSTTRWLDDDRGQDPPDSAPPTHHNPSMNRLESK